MGGAIGEGNRTPAAEFNIWADPEAAQRVFGEGLDTTMVGLDVTHRALIKDEHTERMRGAGRVGKVVAELMDFYARFHKRRYPDLDGSPMHDPVCIAHLIDPTLMDVRDAFIEVDCTTGPSWGRTNVDWRGREHFGAPNAKVGLDIDGARFAELVVERISCARMIVFGAIAPHGNPVYEQPDGPTATGMHELARRLDASGAEARSSRRRTARSSTATSASCARRASPSTRTSSSTAARLYEGDGDPELADACVAALQAAGLPALGLTFGTTAAGGSTMPIDWGAGIPLTLPPRPGGDRHAVPCPVERRPRPCGRGTRPSDRRSAGCVRRQRRPRARAHPRRPVRLQRALRCRTTTTSRTSCAETRSASSPAGTRSGRRTRSPTASGRC